MIAPICFPPAQPEALVNAKLALAMKEAGWHVDIVTEALQSDQWYPFQPEAWLPLDGSVHNVPAMARTPKNSLFCALRSYGLVAGHSYWAIPAFECIQKLVGNTSYDLILSRANPDSAHLPAMMTHKRTGIPWIANWNDPLPCNKFPPPYGQGLQSKMRLIEIIYYKKIVKQCSWHTFPCERLRQYMISYLPDIGQELLSSHTSPWIVIADPQFHIKDFPCAMPAVFEVREILKFFWKGSSVFVSRHDLNSLSSIHRGSPYKVIELSQRKRA